MRSWERSRVAVAVAGLVTLGCGHTTKVRPTPEGRIDAEVEVGGPMGVVGGKSIPLPLLTAGASRGLNDRVDVGAHLHVTQAVFGVAGLDVSAGYLALEQAGAVPALMVSGRFYGYTDFKAFRPYAELSVAPSWLLRDRYLSYLGLSALFQVGGPPIGAVSLGEQVLLGNHALTLELRWWAPYYPTHYVVVNWVGPAEQGAIGGMLGYRFRFGGQGGQP